MAIGQTKTSILETFHFYVKEKNNNMIFKQSNSSGCSQSNLLETEMGKNVVFFTVKFLVKIRGMIFSVVSDYFDTA